ncbi:hypothetical protein KAW48_11190 [candidate division WOR-3 bacterium]|nr:hypothetical protein [candidate division WOR-3 bacterium]
MENTEQQNTSFWNRFGYGIGFNAGVCLSSSDLIRVYRSYPSDYNKIYYYLYTLEFKVSYCLNEKWGIEGGIEFGWKNLEDVDLRIMVIEVESLDSLYYIISKDQWSFLVNKCNVKIKGNNSYYFGLSAYWVRAYNEEVLLLYTPEESDTVGFAEVKRWCGGFGIVFGREFRGWFNGHLKPFAELEIGGAKEYRNNAPWQWEWDDGLWVSFTGVYLGLTYKIGGVK